MSLLSSALFRGVYIAASGGGSRSLCRGGLTAAAAAVAAAASGNPPRRFAGHSRWQNVRSDKEAGTAQKRSLIENYTRQLRKAVMEGGGSTSQQTNVHLKAVFERARVDNVPMKTLERLLAARSQEAAEPYAVELRGKGGICVLVQCNSPARIKCKQEVASLVKKVGLEVAGVDSALTGSFFDKLGCVEVARDARLLDGVDRATELALELDCADVRLEEGGGGDGAGDTFVFECGPTAVAAVSAGLQAAGLTLLDAGVRYRPLDPVEVDADTADLLEGLYDRLRDNVDGVVAVFDNVVTARE